MEKILTPLKAIKEKCHNDCANGVMAYWKECPITNCALYPYRCGNPNKRKTKPLTEEEKRILTERLQKVRKEKKL